MVQKILILDDEPSFADMLQGMLEEHYFVCDVAHEPSEALHKLEQNGYSLVLADYRMPGMDGAEFLVKAREVDPDLPLFIISGLMNTPDLLKVANLGVTLVLEKPVKMDVLLESVRRYVQPLSARDYYRMRSGKKPEEVTAGTGSSAESEAPRYNYPRPLHYLSDCSPCMRPFLQHFHEALANQTHVFVKTPAGSEVELLLREASWWQQPGERHHRFLMAHRPPEDQGQRLFGDLLQSTAYSRVVGVLGYQLANGPQQEALVDCLREAPDELTFVHFMNANLLELSSGRIQSELLDLLRENLCELPPFSRRLADVTSYTLRYLPIIARKEGKPECASLDESACGLFLNHSWPFNFGELLAVLRRAVMLSPRQPIEAGTLQAAFRRNGSGTDINPRLLGLGEWLTQYQRDFLRQWLPTFGNDLGELLNAAAAAPELCAEPPPLEELPLLYEDLLEEQPVS